RSFNRGPRHARRAKGTSPRAPELARRYLAAGGTTKPSSSPRSSGSEQTMPSWWQTGVIYQIYPRSFQDSDGNGVGDLAGIVRRLPYLVELGVDAIWLSPVFVSPMADFGYDIADYTAIDPLFGTLADFDRLLAAAHAHGLKLILDLVPNHTSD